MNLEGKRAQKWSLRLRRSRNGEEVIKKNAIERL
jgi:hypothetical protein